MALEKIRIIQHIVIAPGKGAHAIAVDAIVEDGVVLSEKISHPIPLSDVDLSEYLDASVIATNAANEALQAQLSTQTEALAQLAAIIAERDALLAQVAELTAPPAGRNLTIEQYRDRFTQSELVAVLQAAYAGDANCQLLLLKVQTATEGIDLDSQAVIDGLAYLTGAGLIADGRAAEIRA